MPPSAIFPYWTKFGQSLILVRPSADDHDTFCSAFLEEKKKENQKKQALQKAVWIPQTDLSLALNDKKRRFALAHCRDPRLAVVYILDTVLYTVSTPGICTCMKYQIF
jgi:hypothetical protein